LQIILQDLGKVSLKFTSSEMLEHGLPVRRIVVETEVGFQFSRYNPQGSGFSDSVRADESENLTWTRGRQTVELEGVCCISVSDFFVQIGWEVDDVDCPERTLLRTDSASYYGES